MGTGKRNKFKERLANSYKREVRRIETKEGLREPLIVLSFRNFDRNQGQDFAMWEREQLLALAVGKLREICQLTVGQATAQRLIKPYTKVGFPPQSGFFYPKHVRSEEHTSELQSLMSISYDVF